MKTFKEWLEIKEGAWITLGKEKLPGGFSDTDPDAEQNELQCPHCGTELNGEEDVIQGNMGLICRHCEKAIDDIPGEERPIRHRIPHCPRCGKKRRTAICQSCGY